jgi:hypothetical protein
MQATKIAMAAQAALNDTVVLTNVSAPAVPSAQKATLLFEVVGQEIDAITAERHVWEGSAYRVANDSLYAILQKCHVLYTKMEGTSQTAKELRQALSDVMATRGIETRSTTHTINKIVRCVFGTNDPAVAKQRISAYSVAVRSAIANNIPPAALPEYLTNEGGIEALRGRATGRTTNSMTQKEKALVAAKTVNQNALGVVKHATLGQNFDAGKTDKPAVLIGTWQADGTIVINALVQGQGVVNAALASHYSIKKAERVKLEAEAEQQMISEETTSAIKVASAQAILSAAFNG